MCRVECDFHIRCLYSHHEHVFPRFRCCECLFFVKTIFPRGQVRPTYHQPDYISTGSLEAAERGAVDDGNGESGGERRALQHDATHT